MHIIEGQNHTMTCTRQLKMSVRDIQTQYAVARTDEGRLLSHLQTVPHTHDLNDRPNSSAC